MIDIVLEKIKDLAITAGRTRHQLETFIYDEKHHEKSELQRKSLEDVEERCLSQIEMLNLIIIEKIMRNER